jgi:hypothetical protein
MGALTLRRNNSGWGPGEKRLLAIGVVAGAATAAAVAAEFARVWQRGSAPMPSETDDVIGAAEEAVAEALEVARAGYQEAPTSENAAFNLLVSFVTTFGMARMIASMLRERGTFGPFRNLRVGRRHIHHFVPGIAIAFGSGAVAVVTRNESLEPKLAILFGFGMGLTLDESALLLELDDVYWTREGLLSVEITLAVTALLAALALGARLMRRGEQIVLEHDEATRAESGWAYTPSVAS